jgi:hypothetical protein
MTVYRSKEVLQAGMASALEKMSSAKCLPKKEITDRSFLELYVRIFMKLRELEIEICKVKEDYSDAVIPVSLLNAIRSEAGDIIAFASGVVAKVDVKLETLIGKQLVFPGFDK